MLDSFTKQAKYNFYIYIFNQLKYEHFCCSLLHTIRSHWSRMTTTKEMCIIIAQLFGWKALKFIGQAHSIMNYFQNIRTFEYCNLKRVNQITWDLLYIYLVDLQKFKMMFLSMCLISLLLPQSMSISISSPSSASTAITIHTTGAQTERTVSWFYNREPVFLFYFM